MIDVGSRKRMLTQACVGILIQVKTRKLYVNHVESLISVGTSFPFTLEFYPLLKPVYLLVGATSNFDYHTLLVGKMKLFQDETETAHLDHVPSVLSPILP